MTNVVTETPLSEQDKFRKAAKVRLIELGMTIKDLAEDPRVSASRTAVSMAINRGLNKGVLARIRSVLDL